MKVTRNRGQTTPCTTVQNSENTTYWLCNGYHNHLTIYGDHYMILWSWTDWICILSFPSIFFCKILQKIISYLKFYKPPKRTKRVWGLFFRQLAVGDCNYGVCGDCNAMGVIHTDFKSGGEKVTLFGSDCLLLQVWLNMNLQTVVHLCPRTPWIVRKKWWK